MPQEHLSLPTDKAPFENPSFDSGAAATLLHPRSVAIVGASDRSRWSSTAFENLSRCGFGGDIFLVNRRGGTVHGRAAAESCAAVGGGIDLGIVLVPSQGVREAVEDLAAAGARSAVILTAGFAETGHAGRHAQDEIVRAARHKGLRLLGPNCLGFINFRDGAPIWTTPVRQTSRAGRVAIVSQSGATALFLANLAHQQGVDLTYVISTGNEADLDFTAFIEYLVEDPQTRAIAIFVETIRDPARFIRSAEAALAAGKPVVVLKVGASEVTAKAAQAHTGALVGDDRVFDGVCAQFGLIRVSSIDELLATAEIAARTGPLRAGGIAVVSNSGGICEIAADTAHRYGLGMPAPSPETEARLRAVMPDFATPNNPLDVTGGIEPDQCESILGILGSEPDYAAILCPWYEIPTAPEQMSERLTQLHLHLSRGLNAAPVPGFIASYTGAVVNDFARSIIAETGAPYIACGLDRAVSGLGAVARWSEQRRNRTARRSPAAGASGAQARPRSEWDALRFLDAHGVPVVPAVLAASEAEAVDAAQRIGGPVVLKIASPDIAHKSDIGGVILNVVGADGVAAAYRQILANAALHAGDARVEGVLVAPMRERGLELFVGVTRDPQWGPVLALGLGGIWVETMKDVALRLLPLAASDVHGMLRSLRGAKLLDGQRGVPAADRDRIAAVVHAIGEAALGLGPDLEALEINPLWVRGESIEALDALAVWRAADAPARAL